LADLIDQLDRRVQDARNKLLTQPRLVDNPFDQANLALGLGLARQALDDILLRSRGPLLRAEGAELQIRLSLMLGRARAAREMLEDEGVRKVRERLGRAFVPLPAHEWLLLCVQAADGDYEPTDGLLRAILIRIDQETSGVRYRLQRALALTVAGEVASGDPKLHFAWWDSQRAVSQVLARLA